MSSRSSLEYVINRGIDKLLDDIEEYRDDNDLKPIEVLEQIKSEGYLDIAEYFYDWWTASGEEWS